MAANSAVKIIAEAAGGRYWVEDEHPDVAWVDNGRELIGTPLSRLDIEKPAVAAELRQQLAGNAMLLAELEDSVV